MKINYNLVGEEGGGYSWSIWVMKRIVAFSSP